MQGWTLIICIFLFIACGKDQDTRVGYTDDFLLDLLVDLHIAESAVARLKEDKVDSIRQVYMQVIEERHGMGEERIDSIVEALRNEPERMSELYNRITDTLEFKGSLLEN